jgi:hypothetical protein
MPERWEDDPMPERWLAMVAVGADEVRVVDAIVPNAGRMQIEGDHTWSLQAGQRPAAYRVMHQQVANYVAEHGINRVIVKSSALSLNGTKLAHLRAAELRGVIICAAASVAPTKMESKARLSRTFGSRKVDDYVSDEDFWPGQVDGRALRKGSREAALLLLAERETE